MATVPARPMWFLPGQVALKSLLETGAPLEETRCWPKGMCKIMIGRMYEPSRPEQVIPGQGASVRYEQGLEFESIGSSGPQRTTPNGDSFASQIR
jgi:hypothetical protein